MNSKEITYIFLAFIAILLYNSFLIRRDNELFKAYDVKVSQIKYNQQLSEKNHLSNKLPRN